MIHDKPHPLAGKTVTVKIIIPPSDKPSVQQGFKIEDWWDRVAGESWTTCDGNPACLQYAMRSGFAKMPIDNEVVYGKVGALGHIVHISEIIEGSEE